MRFGEEKRGKDSTTLCISVNCIPANSWLFLALVLDRFSRQVIGWSMQSGMKADLIMRALLMAVWRCQFKTLLIVHFDQGSPYTSFNWQNFLKAHNLISSMSRRINYHANAADEGFFWLVKRERIKRQIYPEGQSVRSDNFNYIEMFPSTAQPRQQRHVVASRV